VSTEGSEGGAAAPRARGGPRSPQAAPPRGAPHLVVGRHVLEAVNRDHAAVLVGGALVVLAWGVEWRRERRGGGQGLPLRVGRAATRRLTGRPLLALCSLCSRGAPWPKRPSLPASIHSSIHQPYPPPTCVGVVLLQLDATVLQNEFKREIHQAAAASGQPGERGEKGVGAPRTGGCSAALPALSGQGPAPIRRRAAARAAAPPTRRRSRGPLSCRSPPGTAQTGTAARLGAGAGVWVRVGVPRGFQALLQAGAFVQAGVLLRMIAPPRRPPSAALRRTRLDRVDALNGAGGGERPAGAALCVCGGGGAARDRCVTGSRTAAANPTPAPALRAPCVPLAASRPPAPLRPKNKLTLCWFLTSATAPLARQSTAAGSCAASRPPWLKPAALAFAARVKRGLPRAKRARYSSWLRSARPLRPIWGWG
jgi:hypothetical protein